MPRSGPCPPLRPAAEAIDDRRARLHLQGDHLALQWPYRRPGDRWDAIDIVRPGARREENHIGLTALASDLNALRLPGLHVNRLDRGVFMQAATGPQKCFMQRPHELAVVDLMILHAGHRSADAWRQMRFHATGLPPGEPFDLKSETAMELIGVSQFGRIIAMGRDSQYPLIAIAKIDARYRLQLRREIRPGCLAFQI